jgi:hypothetical protein
MYYYKTAQSTIIIISVTMLIESALILCQALKYTLLPLKIIIPTGNNTRACIHKRVSLSPEIEHTHITRTHAYTR